MKDEAGKVDDCWNRIGVWSNTGSSCERLEDVVHCRNCDIFVAAGRQIFERELSSGYRQENLAILASADAAIDQDSVGIIVFRLGAEHFALPVNVFETVTESRPVHRLPHVNSPYVKGVVNISGEVCLCHSLMAVLAVDLLNDESERRGRHIYRRLIVVNLDGGRYIFPVDEVKGMARFHPAQLKSAPATINDEVRQLIKGTFQLEAGRVAVLDVGRLHRMLHVGKL